MEKVTTNGTAANQTELSGASSKAAQSERAEENATSSKKAHRTRASSGRSLSPTPDVSASIKVQQLADLNKKIQSASTGNDVTRVEELVRKRDALVSELESIASVDVVQRADGTVRIRTNEGRFLLDSAADPGGGGSDTAEVLPPPSSAGSGEAVSSAAREAASSAYNQIEGGGGAKPSDVNSAPARAATPTAPTITGIASVDQAVDLEAKIAVLTNIESSLAATGAQLTSLQSHQADIDAVLG